MSSSRRYLLLQRRMMSSSPKLYPVGRDHPRPEDRITILGGPSALLGRVKFLIDDIVDLDVAANHARRAAAWKKRMAPHRAIETCNAIIGAMCDAGRSGDAIDLFDFFFNKSEMKPNISSCNLIIKSHCEHGRLDDALRLYTHLSSSENTTPSPDHKTYDLLTKALVDAGTINQALDLLLEGRRVLFNFQEPGMYMNLVRGFLEQGNLDMAYQLRDDFTTCSIRNKIAVLDSVFVEHLFKQGKDEEAMELYRSSVNNKDGFTANGTVGNPYLKLLLTYGQKKQAWALFQYMLDNYVCCFGFNKDTVNMMVNECFDVGRFGDAVNVFNKAKATLQYGLPVEAYRNIITRLCQNGRLSDAETMFNGLVKEQGYHKPDVETYKALIRAYVESSRVEDAVQTSNKMMASKLHRATQLFF
ncbi:pentatricopeptide repeat-containing protein At3g60980, mitochondrial-like [Brassica napus]|nr:pentatricopeptide repeat-containing protein At3g60980, mitochondrial-like [Brassica napus]